MIVLSGASASGKTEVAKILANKYGITRVITTTTRPIRATETDGIDYFFVTKEKFLEMIKDDEFVEFTEFNGNFYGSTKAQVRKDKCIVIDPVGLKAYSALNNQNVVTFFLECNENLRYERMISRGDPKEDASRRTINDRVAFARENICEVDFHIQNENNIIEEVADKIYSLYLKKIHSSK